MKVTGRLKRAYVASRVAHNHPRALSKFVNLIDKSDRFLIIENMSAAPQQTGQNLNVQIKIDTFMRERQGDVL